MNPDRVDWQALERMRRAFLDGAAGHRDYWRSERDLASYDATFAQRIGWKWDFVLGDLRARGWRPPLGVLVDWGCGTGIATRAFLDHFGSDAVSAVRVHDRSPLAMEYALGRIGERFPGLPCTTGMGATPDVVVISHLLTELEGPQVDQLLERLGAATSILWVEPGTFAASRALIAVRERLRNEFHLLAPCPHQASCGLLAPGNEAHWCHHFAKPPPGIFGDPFWGRFAHLLDVDLRSVPLSYLVLDRRDPSPLPPGTFRILGRPHVSKAACSVFACEATRVAELSWTRREHPDRWDDARKGRLASLQVGPAGRSAGTPT